MLVKKQFSNVNREEERVFSVLMNEDEIRLFSNYLEEREYTSKRAAKKIAKKIAAQTQQLANGEINTETFNANVKKIGSTNAGRKVLTITKDPENLAPSTVNLKAMKSNSVGANNAAHDIAHSLSNGVSESGNKLEEQLKHGSTGVNINTEVARGTINNKPKRVTIVQNSPEIMAKRAENKRRREEMKAKIAAQKAEKRKMIQQRRVEQQKNSPIQTVKPNQPLQPQTKPVQQIHPVKTQPNPTYTQPKTKPVVPQTKPTQTKSIIPQSRFSWDNLSNREKIALGIGGGLALGTGAAYLYNRNRRKKRERELN